MYEGIMGRKHIWRYHYLVQGLFSFFLAVLIVVNAALHRWYVYCFWEFGLFYAGKLHQEYALKDEHSIFDVKADACGGFKQVFEEVCPDLCDYFSVFLPAGGVMILCAIVCLVFHACSVWAHCVKSSKSRLMIHRIEVLYIVPPVVYSFGVVALAAALAASDIKSTGKNDSKESLTIEHNPENFSFGGGLYMGVLLAILQVGWMLYGMLVMRKGFKG